MPNAVKSRGKNSAVIIPRPALGIRVLAIYQILMDWETYKYYYETIKLPNPRPTQPKKNSVQSGIWATFSHGK